MTTVQKTITIPANRRVNIELALPESLPVGMADVVMTISPKKQEPPRMPLGSLAGSLADSKSLAGDSVGLVRRWRDEW